MRRLWAGLVLSALALSLTWVGHPWFEGLLALGVTAGAWEWVRMVHATKKGAAFIFWLLLGAGYLGLPVLALWWLRYETGGGPWTVYWLFAIVWGADIAAYFAGRALGGPKLWPQVSPNKTWSGAIGGLLGALALGVPIGWFGREAPLLWLFAISAFLAVVSMAGDLLESKLKRQFGLKDTSRLIPGHGGFLDRVDSLIAAAVVMALLGLATEGRFYG